MQGGMRADRGGGGSPKSKADALLPSNAALLPHWRAASSSASKRIGRIASFAMTRSPDRYGHEWVNLMSTRPASRRLFAPKDQRLLDVRPQNQRRRIAVVTRAQASW